MGVVSGAPKAASPSTRPWIFSSPAD